MKNPTEFRSSVRFAIAAILGSAVVLNALPAAAAEDESLEEVQITGSRIKRANDFDTPNPTTVVDSEYFKQLGIVNVGDAVRQLPSNVSNNSPTTTGNANFFAGSTIANLRGLNPFFGSRTLNLVDGQRFVPTNQGDGVDLNFIPTILIDRMEVVTGGASAAYGSGAISGVNNIMLNHRLEGGKVDADFGQSNYGDAKDRRIAAAFGTSVLNGRGHVVLGIEHEDSDPLGCISVRDWCAKNIGFLTNPANPTGGANTVGPQYILSRNIHLDQTNATGVLRPFAGGVYALNSAGTGLEGYTIGTGGNPGAGNNTVGGDGEPLNLYTNLRAPVKRDVGTGSFTYDINDDLKLTINASYGKVNTVNRTGEVGENFNFIAPDNAYLTPAISGAMPGGALLSKDWTSQVNSYSEFNTRVQRISAGLSGKFGDSSWTWDAYYQYGDTLRSQLVNDNIHLTRYNFAIDSVLVNGVPECRVTQQIANGTGPAAGSNDYVLAQGCVPLNPFGTGQISQAAHDYAWGYLLETLKYTQQVLAFNSTGDLFEGFGAGAIKGAAGVELREERGNNIGSQSDSQGNPVNELVRTDYLIQYGSSFSGKVDVMEGYAEVDVPLLKDVTAAKRLDVNLAGRASRYKNEAGANTAGGSAENNLYTWKGSLIWDPIDWLRVRGSQSRDARAANFRELYYGQVLNSGGLFGWCNGFQVDACTYYLQGNPSLKPEKSDTTTVGLVFTPADVLPGFQFAADYFHIKITDAIQQANSTRVLQGCTISNLPEFCSLITTDDGTAAKQPTGVGIHQGASNINTITATSFNGSGYKYSGIDFTGTYRLQLANADALNFRLLSTRMLKQEFQPTPGQPFVDLVGQLGTSNAFLNDYQATAKWIGNLATTYTHNDLAGTVQARYVSSGVMNYIGCEGTCTPPAGGSSMSDNHVPSYVVFGANTSYTFHEVSFAKTLQLWGSIDNVLNRDPPIASGVGFGGGGNAGTNPVFYDTIGRYFRVGVRAEF